MIGRRRSNTGGNLLLPDGQNVEGLVAGVVTYAYRGSGFRVVEGDDGARPLDVEILELWGFDLSRDPINRKTVEFRSRIRISGGPPPFGKASFACGRAKTTSGGASAALWSKLIRSGLVALATQISDELAQPNAVPTWACQPSP